MTYKLCENKIKLGLYDTQEEMTIMLDIFFAGGRITASEYQSLVTLLSSRHSE